MDILIIFAVKFTVASICLQMEKSERSCASCRVCWSSLPPPSEQPLLTGCDIFFPADRGASPLPLPPIFGLPALSASVRANAAQILLQGALRAGTQTWSPQAVSAKPKKPQTHCFHKCSSADWAAGSFCAPQPLPLLGEWEAQAPTHFPDRLWADMVLTWRQLEPQRHNMGQEVQNPCVGSRPTDKGSQSRASGLALHIAHGGWAFAASPTISWPGVGGLPQACVVTTTGG